MKLFPRKNSGRNNSDKMLFNKFHFIDRVLLHKSSLQVECNLDHIFVDTSDKF